MGSALPGCDVVRPAFAGTMDWPPFANRTPRRDACAGRPELVWAASYRDPTLGRLRGWVCDGRHVGPNDGGVTEVGHRQPQGLKPTVYGGHIGTTEAVP